MPLGARDRRFLQTVDRLKIYLLAIAGGILMVLLLTPPGEIQAATTVIGLTLCGVFWLTQRLLMFISVLDLEITRLTRAVMESLPEHERGAVSGSS